MAKKKLTTQEAIEEELEKTRIAWFVIATRKS